MLAPKNIFDHVRKYMTVKLFACIYLYKVIQNHLLLRCTSSAPLFVLRVEEATVVQVPAMETRIDKNYSGPGLSA